MTRASGGEPSPPDCSQVEALGLEKQLNLRASIGIWTSTDGATWAAPSCAHSGSNDDKHSMWVDNNPASSYYGNTYVTYNNFAVGGGALYFTRSTDGGVTWSAAIGLTFSLRRNVQVSVAPNGTLLVAAMDEGGGGLNGPRTNFVHRSTDGGVTFGAIQMGPSFLGPGSGVCSTQTYFARIDPIWRYMGWGDLASGSGNVVLYAYTARPGGVSADAGDIFLTRSTDNGATWGTPVRIDGDTSAKAQWMPSVAGGGTTFLVSWYDRRNTTDGTNYERWGTTSTDGGVTWSTPQRISDVLIPQPEQVDPGIQACYAGNHMRSFYDRSTFYDGWTDGRVAINGRNQLDIFVDRIRQPPRLPWPSRRSRRAVPRQASS